MAIAIEFEYLDGKSMESYLFELYENGQYEKIEELICEYITEIMNITGKCPFVQTAKFEEIFGDHKFDSSYTGIAGSNFDIIFSNIIFDKDKGPEGEWNLLDYEWCFDFPIPDKFLAFRGLYYYFEFTNKCLKEYYEAQGINVYNKFGFSDEEVKAFIDMEHRFQVYVIGGVASLEEIGRAHV